MFPSDFPEVQSYPNLKRILKDNIDLQFSDLRTMLKLPKPRYRLYAGLNFMTFATLFNIIAGASVCFYNADPASFRNPRDRGARFQNLLRDFYPWLGDEMYPSARCIDILYREARNPLAHSFGLTSATSTELLLTKQTLTIWQIKQLEDNVSRPRWSLPTISPSANPEVRGTTQISASALYWGIHRMLHRLFGDSAQATRAEAFASRIRPS